MRFADGNYRLHPPGEFDPATGSVKSGGEPKTMQQGDADKGRYAAREKPEPLPYLGGWVLSRTTHGGRTYLCGTRGLVILDKPEPPPLTFAELGARLVVGTAEKALAEALARKVNIQTRTQLEEALQDPNPYYRANALASQFVWQNAREAMTLLVKALDDAHLRVRSTALAQATRSKADDQSIVPALQRRLGDTDPAMRAVAAVELARRGHLSETKHLREILETESYGNFPFGASSTIGVLADARQLCEAVAPIATPEVFALLLEFPPYIRNYDNETKVFPQLGEALRRHPEAASRLLTAYDNRTGGNSSRDFAEHVFRFAGKEMLPILHKALASDDRVVRSNAARACGAIADSSSIAPLIRALDLESGLARASIVRALGQLKAQEALSHLAGLYVDAQNDEKRRRGTGFLAAQSQAESRAQYDSIGNLDALGSDWDELTASSLKPPVDPQRNEELLSPRIILDAVAAIGPATAQEFYRTLAGEKGTEARAEAAARLAECGPTDAGKNVVILKNLLADRDAIVRVPAAVSLLILRQETGQPSILEWLERGERWERLRTVRELRRVSDPALLAFARSALLALSTDPKADGETRAAAKGLLK
jgi:HEAT repeat protein